MCASLIDLPEDLQPVTFLQDVEDGLTGPARDTVNWCKRVSKENDPKLVGGAASEVEQLWPRATRHPGAAVALLYLADWYWRHEGQDHPRNVLDFCERAIDRIPNEQTLTPAITRAAAQYMLGLSYHTTDNMTEARRAYESAAASFGIAQQHWHSVESKEQEKCCNEIASWIGKLAAYVGLVNPPAQGINTLICPWQNMLDRSYILAALALLASYTKRDVTNKQTIQFLSQRIRPWRWVGNLHQIGYAVATRLNIVGINNTISSFHLQKRNPGARFGTDLIIPARALYHVFRIDGALTIQEEHILQDGYFVVHKRETPESDLNGLAWYKDQGEEGLILGTFERDAQNRIRPKETLRPEPIVLGDQTSLEFLGTLDFTLGPGLP